MTDNPRPMAKVALATCKEHGELALIEYLNANAHEASDHLAWTNSGVCLLKDGSAVLQDRHESQDTYSFRWHQEDEQYTAIRSAQLPREQRRFHHHHKGPIYPWPTGDTLADLVLAILSEGARQAAWKAAGHADANNVGNVGDWNARNLSSHQLFSMLPDLAQAIDSGTTSELENAGVDYQAIDSHLEILAHMALKELTHEARNTAEQTMALAALLFEGETEDAGKLANHWNIPLPATA